MYFGGKIIAFQLTAQGELVKGGVLHSQVRVT
jgi:hypothetical protein